MSMYAEGERESDRERKREIQFQSALHLLYLLIGQDDVTERYTAPPFHLEDPTEGHKEPHPYESLIVSKHALSTVLEGVGNRV